MLPEQYFIQNIIRQLVDFYDGPLWVTDSFKRKIAAIPGSLALQIRKPFSYSIAGQVAHMTAWRNFVHQKITGNDNFDIDDNSEADWPKINDWENALQNFEQSQRDLLSDLDHFELLRLDSVVPGRSYTFKHLLNGIVQHDLYHYGQIGTVLAALNTG